MALSLAEKLLLILRVQQGGGTPPAATWDDVVEDLNPIYWFKLGEASGAFANSGSVGGTSFSVDGTVARQQVGLVGATSAIGVESGDGFTFSSPERATTTTIMLIKTPTSLATTDYLAAGGGELIMRGLSDGTLRYVDDLDLNTISSAAGVIKSNQWNLLVWQPNVSGATKLFHTSQDAGGTVSEVASGTTVPIGFISAIVRGSSSAFTAYIDEVIVVSGAVSLASLQELADTLDWS